MSAVEVVVEEDETELCPVCLVSMTGHRTCEIAFTIICPSCDQRFCRMCMWKWIVRGNIQRVKPRCPLCRYSMQLMMEDMGAPWLDDHTDLNADDSPIRAPTRHWNHRTPQQERRRAFFNRLLEYIVRFNCCVNDQAS